MRTRTAALLAIVVAMALVVVPEPRAHALTTSEIKARVTSLKKTLRSVAKDLDDAEHEYEAAQEQMREHAQAVRRADARREELREALSHRAAQLFMLGSLNDLDILAGDGIGVYLDRMSYLEAVRRGETTLLEQVRALQRSAAAERELLEAARSRARAIRDRLDARQDQLSSQLNEMQRLLNFLGSAERQIIGGGNGFVCPVVGANVVLNNYGAPRSGGPHAGVDIRANHGQYVRSVLPGTVIDMPTGSWWGYGIIVRDLSGTEWWYAHLSTRSTSVGARVAGGQVIGRVGCTGNCTGPHLHFEWHPDGGPSRNPYSITARAC